MRCSYICTLHVDVQCTRIIGDDNAVCLSGYGKIKNYTMLFSVQIINNDDIEFTADNFQAGFLNYFVDYAKV